MPSPRFGQVAAIVVVGLALTSVAPGASRHSASATNSPTTSLRAVALPTTFRPPEVDPATPPTLAPAPLPTPAQPPVVAAIATAAPRPPAQPPAPPSRPINIGSVYAIGDSVMIDIQPELSRDIAGVTVDGKVSRQFATGVQVVSGLRSAGRLPPTVIVELGTNGAVTPALFDAMMAAAQGAKLVVFCTVHVPRSWESGDNATLRAGVARYANARLADWFALSQGHPGWFAPDGFHVIPSGARAMAALIASVI